MQSAKFIAAKKIQLEYGVSSATLRNWDRDGKIDTIRTPGGKRLYKSEQVAALFSNSTEPLLTPRAKVCYARVSSDHQRADLQRQIEDLRKAYPGYEILSDVGSGLNYKRKNFLALLDRVIEGNIEQVVVKHRDRLCRFGFEFVEHILKKYGVVLVVHGQGEETTTTDTDELATDLLSVVTVFVAKHNGKRSAENRRRRKREDEEQKTTEEEKKDSDSEDGRPTKRSRSTKGTTESNQNSNFSQSSPETNDNEMDGSSEVDF